MPAPSFSQPKVGYGQRDSVLRDGSGPRRITEQSTHAVEGEQHRRQQGRVPLGSNAHRLNVDSSCNGQVSDDQRDDAIDAQYDDGDGEHMEEYPRDSEQNPFSHEDGNESRSQAAHNSRRRVVESSDDEAHDSDSRRRADDNEEEDVGDTEQNHHVSDGTVTFL